MGDHERATYSSVFCFPPLPTRSLFAQRSTPLIQSLTVGFQPHFRGFGDCDETAALPGTDVYYKKDGVGGWGGKCTCPSGEVFDVGDEGSETKGTCGTLACYGGTAGECSEGGIPDSASGMAVDCVARKCSTCRYDTRFPRIFRWGDHARATYSTRSVFCLPPLLTRSLFALLSTPLIQPLTVGFQPYFRGFGDCDC